MNTYPTFTCTGIAKARGIACPATPEAWLGMVQSPELKAQYEHIASLPYDSEEQEEEKKKLPFWTPHCSLFQANRRTRATALQPLRRVMVDIDQNKGRAQELCQKALSLQEQGQWTVLLVEESARKGVHLLIDIPDGMTAMQAATQFARDLGEECDTTVPLIEHFLYLSPNILYMDRERLFSPTPIPLEQMHTVWNTAKASSGQKAKEGDYKRDYLSRNPQPSGATHKGIPLEDIAQELEHTIGGGPAMKGRRNHQVFAMARLLRQITGDDPALLQTLIPTYGMPAEEHLTAIENALRYISPLPYIPHDLQRAIDRASRAGRTATPEDVPPAMPSSLPPSMKHILSASPEKAREATAMGAFSPLRVLMSDVRFHYVDNTAKEPCFINMLVAEQGSGKSAIQPVIEAILQPITARDEESRRREAEWRDKCTTLGANKDKPQAPKAPIQRIYANTTLAALNKRAHLAGNLSLYTYAEEAEQIFLRLPECSSILRSAYDSAKDGQERVSAHAVSDEVHMRWSINISTQPPTARRLLKGEYNNGLLTRACISTIYTPSFDWGEEMPIYGEYDEHYHQGLKPYLDRLAQTKGTIQCTEAEKWMQAEKKKQIERLRDMDAKYLLPYLWRSLQQSFWRACMLYIMEDRQWSTEIEQFASWSLEYDLWCKVHFFGDLIENACTSTMPDNSQRRTNLLALLPDQFTRQQASNLRRDMGKGASAKEVKNMIAQWVHCRKIRFDEETKLYIKLPKDAA